MMAEAIQYMKLPNCTDKNQKFKDQIYITQVKSVFAQFCGIRLSLSVTFNVIFT